MTDEPYVPKVSTKKLPAYYDKVKKNARERTGNPPSQKERVAKHKRELKAMNIHKPGHGIRAENVKAIRDLKNHLRLAGYDTVNPAVLLAMANNNLSIPHFNDLVTAFEIEEKARMKINVEDVVRWFNDIATQAMGSGDFTNANRAMENLAKYLGMFIERKEITHKSVHSKEELDTRISELTAILKEAEPDIERKLRIH